MKKNIFSIDVDGTLVNQKNKISRSSINWMIDALNWGNIIAINSSRSQESLEKLFKEYFPFHYHQFIYSSYGGTLIYEYDENKKLKILFEDVMDMSQIKFITIDAIKQDFLVQINEDFRLYGNKSFLKKIFCFFGKLENMDLLDITAYKAFSKIEILSLNKTKIRNFMTTLRRKYKTFSFKEVYNGIGFQIKSISANKGKIIEYLKSKHPNHTVVAIGDSANDLPTFNLAQRSYVPSTAREDMLLLDHIESIENKYNDAVATMIRESLNFDFPFIIASPYNGNKYAQYSIQAFERFYLQRIKAKSIGTGIHFLTDVALTKDQQIIIFSDEACKQLLNKTVHEATWEEIKIAFSKKEPLNKLTTLENMLSLFKETNRIYINLNLPSSKAIVSKLIKTIIDQNSSERVVLSLNDWSLLSLIQEEIKKQNVFIRTSFIKDEKISKKDKEAKSYDDFDTIELQLKDSQFLAKNNVKMAFKKGFQLSLAKYGNITRSKIDNMIDWEIYGIITNDVENVLSYYEYKKEGSHAWEKHKIF